MTKEQIIELLGSRKWPNKSFSTIATGFDKENLVLVWERLEDDENGIENPMLIIADCSPNPNNSLRELMSFDDLVKKGIDYTNMVFMFADDITAKYGTLQNAREQLFSDKLITIN